MSRVPLAMLPLPDPPRVACTTCGKCCTYVSVGINPPRTLRFASDILWYLYHDGLSVYRDGEGDWSVVFETRCRQLGDDLLCTVYADRPVICREFDDGTCEVNAPGGGRSFATAEAFLHYLQGWRPRLYRRLLKGYVPAGLARAIGEHQPPPAPGPATNGGRARR